MQDKSWDEMSKDEQECVDRICNKIIDFYDEHSPIWDEMIENSGLNNDGGYMIDEIVAECVKDGAFVVKGKDYLLLKIEDYNTKAYKGLKITYVDKVYTNHADGSRLWYQDVVLKLKKENYSFGEIEKLISEYFQLKKVGIKHLYKYVQDDFMRITWSDKSNFVFHQK